jgi:PKD repeat protein
MRRFILLALVVSFLLAAPVFADPVKTVARVYVPDADTLARLLTYDVRMEDFDGADHVRIIGYRQGIDDVIAAGFEVEVLIDDLDTWSRARAADLRAHPPKKTAGDVTLDHFLTYPELETFYNDLQTAHSDIMSMEVVGQTVSGRNMYLIKISDNVGVNEAQPAVYFEYNIHGDEIAGYIIMAYFVQQMVTQYGTDPTITNLINSREMYIIPLSNPDGNQTSGYGRSRYNDDGIDLNRNFGFMWNGAFEYAAGSGPFSEPETQAQGGVLARSQPFEAEFSGHSGDVIFIYAWGYTTQFGPDQPEMDWVGSQYVYPNHCQDPLFTDYYQVDPGLYQCWGTASDSIYGNQGALGFTTETSYDKECDWATAYGIAQHHFPALVWTLQEMGNGLHGMVTDNDTGDPVAADILVDNKWYTYTDSDVGDYHKYLRPGSYHLKVTANGYDPYEQDFTITSGAPTNIDVQLTKSASPTTFGFRVLTAFNPVGDYESTLAFKALGAPDADYVALGSGGYIVIDLGPGGIANGAGDDLVVYDSGSGNPFALYGSNTWNGPWTSIGTGSGTKAFDLQGTGLTSVRYVKIQDTSDELRNATSASNGYHLDAVGTAMFVASFSGDPTTGGHPLPVQFTDQSTGSPTGWDWDFGDGNTSHEQNPMNTYQDIGTYTVMLTVHKGGDTATVTRTDYIQVVELPPVADFTGDPLTGPMPLQVQFTDQSTGVVTDYFWQFGDWTNSTEQNPVHIYNKVGKYTVRLTVTGPGGSNTKVSWGYINVTEADDDTAPDDDATPDDDTATDDDVAPDDDATPDDDAANDDDAGGDDDATSDDDASTGDDSSGNSGCGC